jgi:hypothetical protein
MTERVPTIHEREGATLEFKQIVLDCATHRLRRHPNLYMNDNAVMRTSTRPISIRSTVRTDLAAMTHLLPHIKPALTHLPHIKLGETIVALGPGRLDDDALAPSTGEDAREGCWRTASDGDAGQLQASHACYNCVLGRSCLAMPRHA